MTGGAAVAAGGVVAGGAAVASTAAMGATAAVAGGAVVAGGVAMAARGRADKVDKVAVPATHNMLLDTAPDVTTDGVLQPMTPSPARGRQAQPSPRGAVKAAGGSKISEWLTHEREQLYVTSAVRDAGDANAASANASVRESPCGLECVTDRMFFVVVFAFIVCLTMLVTFRLVLGDMSTPLYSQAPPKHRPPAGAKAARQRGRKLAAEASHKAALARAAAAPVEVLPAEASVPALSRRNAVMDRLLSEAVQVRSGWAVGCLVAARVATTQGEYELNEQHSKAAHTLLQRVHGVGKAPRGLARVKKGLDRVWIKKTTGRSRK